MIHRGDLTMNESIFLKINEETQLKYLSLNDAHELFNLIEKNRNYLRQWLPWLDHNKTLEDSTSYIQKSILGYQAKDELSLAIIYNKNIVGTKNKQIVEEYYSIEANSRLYVNCFNKMIKRDS